VTYRNAQLLYGLNGVNQSVPSHVELACSQEKEDVSTNITPQKNWIFGWIAMQLKRAISNKLRNVKSLDVQLLEILENGNDGALVLWIVVPEEKWSVGGTVQIPHPHMVGLIVQGNGKKNRIVVKENFLAEIIQ